MNNIALAAKYQPLLDEIFKLNALTSDLESENVKFDGVHTVKILKITVPSLGQYTKNSGFTSGDVDVAWEDWELTQDRGRSFSIDAVDDEETMDASFGAACKEFMRLKVAPQIDAYRFAKLASWSGISSATGTLDTGAKVISALRTATLTLDNDEVPKEGRILYITYTAKGLIDDLDTTKSKAVLEKFSKIIEVPSSRFYTKSKYNSSTQEIEKDTANGGTDLNFLVVTKEAVQATAKHAKLRIFLADGDEGTGANKNQKADSHEFQYRIVHDINVYANKVAGIYAHSVAAAGGGSSGSGEGGGSGSGSGSGENQGG